PISFADQPQFGQQLRCDFRTIGNFVVGVQAIQPDFLILDAEDIGEAAFERQTAHQRQLTALEVRPLAAACARALTFCTAPGGLAFTGRDTATNAGLFFLGTLSGLQIVQFHDYSSTSSTSTRWLILLIMPRIEGVS